MVDLIAFIFIFGIVALLAAACWVWKLENLVMDNLIGLGKAGFGWVLSEDGTCDLLPEKLAYRDFLPGINGIIETTNDKTPVYWAGIRIIPIATDGLSGAEWNYLGEQLNRVYTGLPPNTWVQVIEIFDNNVNQACEIFEKIAQNNPESPLAPLSISRANHYKRLASKGKILRREFYVFIGVELKSVVNSVPILKTYSGDQFIDVEQERVEKEIEKLLRIRDSFIASYLAAGGDKAEPVTSKVAFDIAYRKLNPTRAIVHPAPAYDNELTYTNKENTNSEDIRMTSSRASLFADNPRETLCFEDIRIEGDHLMIGDTYCTTISLKKLPTKVCPGLIERLSRNTNIDFEYMDICATYKVGDPIGWDEKFERQQWWIRRNLKVSGNNPNLDEQVKDDDFESVRRQLREGEEGIGEFGLNITIYATSLNELSRRRDIVLIALRSMEGAEGISEHHVQFDQFRASLPATPFTDNHLKVVLSHDAISMSSLTSGPDGVDASEATDIYLRADKGIFKFNPNSKSFNNSMGLVIGQPGAGKSGLLNSMRITHILNKVRCVSIDLDGSCKPVCDAVGGNYFDQASANGGLGLFDIYPRSDEFYEPNQLTEYGLPKDRLSNVQSMMEIFCSIDQFKEPRFAAVLRKTVDITYRRLDGEIPALQHVIKNLNLIGGDDREYARDLAARLEIYSADGSLGSLLNDQSELPSVDAPYTVFNLTGAKKDERLVLVYIMGIINFLGRFAKVDPQKEKYLDIDEFHFYRDKPLLEQAAELLVRTARKDNMGVLVASHDGADFMSERLRAFRSGVTTWWLLSMTNPKVAVDLFQLGPGVLKEVNKLQAGAQDSRDALLIYQNGTRRSSAHLRLGFGAAESCLALKKGRERATYEEARADLQKDIDSRLEKALKGGKSRTSIDKQVYAGAAD